MLKDMLLEELEELHAEVAGAKCLEETLEAAGSGVPKGSSGSCEGKCEVRV